MIASWPGGEVVGAELTDLLEMADRSGGPVTSAPVESQPSSPPVLRIAHPINNNGKKLGAIAVELTQVPRDQQAAVVRLIEWGNTWLDLLFRQDSDGAGNADPIAPGDGVHTAIRLPAAGRHVADRIPGSPLRL